MGYRCSPKDYFVSKHQSYTLIVYIFVNSKYILPFSLIAPAISEDESLTSSSSKHSLVNFWPKSDDTDFLLDNKKEAERPKIIWLENGKFVLVKTQEEQTAKNVTNVDEEKKTPQTDTVLPLEAQTDDESPWDSESISENLPQQPVDPFPGDADDGGKHAGNTQTKDLPDTHLHLKPAMEAKDCVAKKAVGIKDVKTFQPDWSFTESNETLKRSEKLMLGHQHPLLAESVMKSPPAFPESESGDTHLHGKAAMEEKDSVVKKAVRMKVIQPFQLEELNIEVTLKEDLRRRDDSENSQDQVEGKRKSGKTDTQQLPTEKKEEHDRFHFRLVLKEEDKRKSLKEKCSQEVEAKQQLEISYATLEMEFKASKVNQLTEAQDRGKSSVQHDEKTEEPLDRIELVCSHLKENVQSLEMEILSQTKKRKKTAGKVEHAQKHLSNDSLLTEAQDRDTSSVQHDEKTEEPLDRIELVCSHLKENVQSLEMEILSQTKKRKKTAGKVEHAQKHLSNDSLLTEAQDRGKSSVQHDEKTEEPLDRIELVCSHLKENVQSLEMEILSQTKKRKKTAGKVEHAQKHLSNDSLLTEAQDRDTSSVQHDEKTEEPLDRIELVCSHLKENVQSLEMEILSQTKKRKKTAGKVEHAQKHLSNDSLLTEAQDRGKSSVQHDEKTEEPLDRIELVCSHLKENVQSLEMEILSQTKKRKKTAGKVEHAQKHLSNDSLLTEAQDRDTSSVQHDEKTEEPLDRIELVCSHLKENVQSLEMEILSQTKKRKKTAGKVEHAQKHLSNDSLLTEAQDRGKSSVQHDEKTEEPLDRIELVCSHLKENVQSLEMEILSQTKKRKKTAGKVEHAQKHLSNDSLPALGPLPAEASSGPLPAAPSGLRSKASTGPLSAAPSGLRSKASTGPLSAAPSGLRSKASTGPLSAAPSGLLLPPRGGTSIYTDTVSNHVKPALGPLPAEASSGPLPAAPSGLRSKASTGPLSAAPSGLRSKASTGPLSAAPSGLRSKASTGPLSAAPSGLLLPPRGGTSIYTDTVSNHVKLTEAQDRGTSSVQHDKKTEEPLDRSVQTLTLENLRLKKENQKLRGKLERAQKHLLSNRLSEDEKEQFFKFTELFKNAMSEVDQLKKEKHDLECALDEIKKKNREPESELAGPQASSILAYSNGSNNLEGSQMNPEHLMHQVIMEELLLLRFPRLYNENVNGWIWQWLQDAIK
ncbi:ankyrin repeat domain-containing protein 26-like isoform X4 [Cavia porcellus]|uniref:ankyrin repeat domain-containing protein 26-like isoform X4 n=1 Tax=Cavia porcellus TaxID=10141 RepID=UPI002FE3E5C3